MRLSGRYALLAYNSAAVLAGVAVTFVLVSGMIAEPPLRPVAQQQPRSPEPNSFPTTDRLTFVRRDAFAEPPAASEPPELRPTIVTGAERVASWAVEVQPGEPPHRVALLPSLRLPWQETSKALAPRQRYYTLKAKLAEISPAASARIAARFEAAKVAWPPAQIALIAIKDERALDLHARNAGGTWTLVHRYRILAASGGAGPKLRQGDKQVPEGLYSISYLNPNGAFHVSMRVNYPNAFDRQMAIRDGRKDLGGDIMIHGKNLSAGCLAMGDEAVEELFLLAAQVGLSNLKVIIAPTDFRHTGIPKFEPGRPDWLPKLYAEIATAMSEYKAPPARQHGSPVILHEAGSDQVSGARLWVLGWSIAATALSSMVTVSAQQRAITGIVHGEDIRGDRVGPAAGGYGKLKGPFAGTAIRDGVAYPFARQVSSAAIYDGFEVPGPHILIEGARFDGPLDIYATQSVVLRGVSVRTSKAGHWAIHTRPEAGPFYMLWSDAGAAKTDGAPLDKTFALERALYLRSDRTVVHRSRISKASDGIQIHAPNALVSESLIDELTFWTGDHNDGIQMLGRGSHARILRNRIINRNAQTSCLNLMGDGNRVEDNFLAGGGWVIYGGANDNGHRPRVAKGNVVTGNRFARLPFAKGGSFGPVAYWDKTGGAGNVWERNRFSDGQPITP